MLLLYIGALSLFVLEGISLRGLLLPTAESLHHFCLGRFPGESVYTLGTALICGKNLESGVVRSGFQNLNLYHVLVVSGAHLVAIASVTTWIERKIEDVSYLTPAVLIAFALMTRLEAPILRALLFWMIMNLPLRFSKQQRPPAELGLLLSYLFSLIFEPKWIGSMSLHLSLLAGLGIQMGQNKLQKAICILLLIAPLLLMLGVPSFPGLLLGFLLSPILELLLLPVMALVWAIPYLGYYLEHPLTLLLSSVSQLSNSLPAGFQSHSHITSESYWFYSLLMLLLFHHFSKLRRRALVDQSHA